MLQDRTLFITCVNGFLELKEIVNQMLLKHVNAPPMLNGQEIKNIKQVVNILEIPEKVSPFLGKN